MSGKMTGGCLCGAVRYRIVSAELPPCYACHCTDCQTQSGSAFGLQIPLPADLLNVTGPLREGKRDMPSGSLGLIYSCEKCAVRIFAANSARPGMHILRAGTLDNSADLIPAFHLWTKSKQRWVTIPEDAVSLAGQPETNEQWMQLFAGTFPSG